MHDMSASGAPITISDISGGWAIAGEVDAYSAPALADTLEGVDGHGTFTVDLEQVAFMDSSGLRVFVEATKRAREHGGDLVLRNPQPAIRRLVEISGLHDHLSIDG